MFKSQQIETYNLELSREDIYKLGGEWDGKEVNNSFHKLPMEEIVKLLGFEGKASNILGTKVRDNKLVMKLEIILNTISIKIENTQNITSIPCSNCEESGEVEKGYRYSEECKECNGTGKIPLQKEKEKPPKTKNVKGR